MMNRNGWMTAIALVFLLTCATAIRAEVVVTITANKDEIATGEALEFKVTATNTSPAPVTLQFTGTPAMYMIMTQRQYMFPTYSAVVGAAEQYKSIEGNGSFTWTFPHRWEAYDLPLGPLEIVGRVNAKGVTASKPLKLRIYDPPPPMKDFLVNFEMIPESQTPIRELGEYRAWCVNFKIVKSPTGTLKLIKRAENNMCLTVTSSRMPTGSNIAADLTVQTNQVSAEVSIKPGLVVKMIARGAEGQILDEVTTPVFQQANTFVPLKVTSKEKEKYITSVEFWPSDPAVALSIDNLAITVPQIP